MASIATHPASIPPATPKPVILWFPLESQHAMGNGHTREAHFGADRAKIIGGWLIRVMSYNPGGIDNVSVTFVPDPLHEWDGNSAREV